MMTGGSANTGLVAGSAVEALGEAAMTANLAVVSALDATCRRQYEMITAAEASPLSSPEELPEFTEENVHVNGDLRVAVMLPVACRPVRHPLHLLCTNMQRQRDICLVAHGLLLLKAHGRQPAS